MIRSFCIFAAIAVVALVSATNYCDPALCSKGEIHIACNSSQDFAKECPPDRKMVELTTDLKNAIIKSHNTKRNAIASGSLKGFEPAKRMATMQWNDELAAMAAFNVKRCKFGHDSCRNTHQFKPSGQNIYKSWFSNVRSDNNTIMDQIDGWWTEIKKASMSDIKSYPVKATHDIGHFTVMATDRNVAVGCAAIKFVERKMNSLTLTCNYASTNIIKSAVYASGKAGSECKTGTNSEYKALCSPTEIYDSY